MNFFIIDLVLRVGCWVIVSVGLHVSGVRDVSGRVSLTGAMLLAGQYERTELAIGMVQVSRMAFRSVLYENRYLPAVAVDHFYTVFALTITCLESRRA